MEQRPEQTPHQKRATDGKWACEKKRRFIYLYSKNGDKLSLAVGDWECDLENMIKLSGIIGCY